MLVRPGQTEASVDIARIGGLYPASVLAELPGKRIILGVINLGDNSVETARVVADRICRALPYVPAEDIIVAPDCGMKYLPRQVAFDKMRAMAAGARLLRDETGAGAVAASTIGSG